MIPTVAIDLGTPAAERWEPLSRFRTQASKLMDSYLADLGGIGMFAWLIDDYRQAFVTPEYWEEVQAIAAMVGRTPEEVLVTNLYYDAFRAVLGCTAFALDTPAGPIHARNLDWWTGKGMLADFTLIVECSGGNCPSPYKIVGWPGFIGVFSAVAEGRFAVTLNAVISAETPQLAQSITLLLRTLFDTVSDYDTAVTTLRETPIAADCLLLVTGTEPGELVVIERTSTKAEVRNAEDGLIVVTNDYRALDSGFAHVQGNELLATACSRFDRVASMVESSRPSSVADCFAVLQDAGVKMGITVQHMVMQASTGLLEVQLPRS